MNEAIKHRLHFKKGEETERKSGFTNQGCITERS